ncbi:hypothetical protein CHS0354_015693 [Potamilus streckersoni]|uniref:Uncharacterized protein n=1 Tax=Potamilus streckersoni TaxID=2493646 RepID=A0AAE0W0D8_9BIVA|nr:hypothetical protein CHS0354_015693 [Potamilus streckersoni]
MMIWFTIGGCAAFCFLQWLIRKIPVWKYSSKYVVITGCDSGFGHLLAKRLDHMDFHVFAGCITEKGATELRKTCSNRLFTLDLDVTSAASIQKAVKLVKSNIPQDSGIWGLVNNAGIAGETGHVEWLTRADYDQVMAVNTFGVVDVTKAFLPLVRKTRGRIVNMASVMGRFPAATAHYVMSKFAVEGYSGVLRYQLRPFGVSVHVIEPGFFQTGITSNELIRKSLENKYARLEPEIQEAYGKEYRDAIITRATHFLQLANSPKVHKVVDAYTHALTARFPKTRYSVGWDANLFFRPLSLLPDWVADLMFGAFLSKPNSK